MKGFAFCTGLLFTVLTIQAQEFAEINKSEDTELSKTITKDVIVPSNIKFTKIIRELPEEAIAYCIDFSKRTNYINTISAKGKKYFPKVNKIFAKYNLPTELNVLLAIESFFNKNCVSHAGAVGYWQFMDATAVEYGLNIDSAKDERKDFNKSTKAAARYLKSHYAILKDWNLTVAAYNCGLGNVKKAIAKSGKVNADFYDIRAYLPKETQNYVLKYIALNILYKNYDLYSSNRIKWYASTEKITEKIVNPAPVSSLPQMPQQ